jgi:uncharacterized membrane protein
MMPEPEALLAAEVSISGLIRAIGVAIDVFGVAIIVIGIVWSSLALLRRRMREEFYDSYKIRIGRSLLLGLEILVAADIVKTIALAPSFNSLGVLGGLIVVRTFLAWTLVLEIEGRWPWQGERRQSALAADGPAARELVSS